MVVRRAAKTVGETREKKAGSSAYSRQATIHMATPCLRMSAGRLLSSRLLSQACCKSACCWREAGRSFASGLNAAEAQNKEVEQIKARQSGRLRIEETGYLPLE